MFRYLKTPRTLLAVGVALIAGYVSAKHLAQGNPLVAVPWGVFAFLSAYIATTKREALILGSCIGFIASYAYLWFDNTDKLTVTKVVTLIPLIALPALFGLLCVWLGWIVRARVSKSK